MTLTELRYIVAVAREKHFGRAAEACHVSQPTLSVGIKKLEEELGVRLFERGNTEVRLTPLGAKIVEQAQQVVEQAAAIRELARMGQDPLAGPLRIGVIYTIAPYLMPEWVFQGLAHYPQMPWVLEENFTHHLVEALRSGRIDCAVLAEPFDEHGFQVQPLFDEPFWVAVPKHHAWSERPWLEADDLQKERMLLLGPGHCLRDQVLEVCPDHARYTQGPEGLRQHLEGSSLETLKYMVAAGMGVTVVPALSVPQHRAGPPREVHEDPYVTHVPFRDPMPRRRVSLAWRKTFSRPEAIEALLYSLQACRLPPAVKRLQNLPH